MKRFVIDTYRVWKHEFSVVFADLGVIIFFLLLPFAYPLVYSSIYNPELARDVPVVIIDECRTPFSREYTRHLDASQYVKVNGYAANFGEAQHAMALKDCYGVIHIPADFDKKTGRGETATVGVFCDMSLLLRYKSILLAVTEVATEMGNKVQADRLSSLEEITSLNTINYSLTPIGNVEQGLATAIMPGVLVLIIQQAIILAVCFLGVGARYIQTTANPASIVLGKALCYLTIMIVPSVFVLHFVPIIFSFPMNGNILELTVFFLPFLLAVIFFGMTIQHLLPDRESTFLLVVFTSVAFVFLSGISWPRYAMSEFWQLVGNCLPSTWGITGYVGLNTTGSTLSQQAVAYLALWIQTIVYFIISCLLQKKRAIK